MDPGAQGENDLRRQYARSLGILMGLVALVLVGACANVTNLLLARGHNRRREMAVRMAVGASGGHLVRQLLVESVLLAGAAAAVGVVVAAWSRDALLALRPFGNTTVVLDLPLDMRVLLFTVSIALAAAVVCGLAPALRATRVDVKAEFLGGPGAIGHGAGSRLSRILMVTQVALALVLLVTTGLFTRTVARLDAVDAGFNRDSLLLFRVDATSAGYDDARAADLHASIRDRLARLPGVQAATFSRVALLSRRRENMTFAIVGQDAPPEAPMNVHTNGIDAGFLEAMELPVLAGRSFTLRDDARAATVAMVNQVFARTYLGDASPLGRILEFNAPGFRHRVEIVGLVRDAKYTDLRGAAPPTAYFPALQHPDGQANFAVRTHGRQAGYAPGHRRGGARGRSRLAGPGLPYAGPASGAAARAGAAVREAGGRVGAVRPGAGLRRSLRVAVGCGRPPPLGDWLAHRARRRTSTAAADGRPREPAPGGRRRAARAHGNRSRHQARLRHAVRHLAHRSRRRTFGVALGLLVATLLASALPAYRASRIDPMAALRLT